MGQKKSEKDVEERHDLQLPREIQYGTSLAETARMTRESVYVTGKTPPTQQFKATTQERRHEPHQDRHAHAGGKDSIVRLVCSA